MSVTTAMNKMSLDEMTQVILDESKKATAPRAENDHRLNVPTDVMQNLMKSQGVDRDSLNNLTDAITNVTRSMHHAGALYMRDQLKNTAKELREKTVVRVKGDIVPKHLRIDTKIQACDRGMTVPRDGHPSQEYTTYGGSKVKLLMPTSLNEQRSIDSKIIEETLKELGH